MTARLVVFDLDGTLYRGESAIPGAVETVITLLKRGVRIRYLTNNSSKTPGYQQEKLQTMGFPVEPGWVMTSSLVAARRLAGSVSTAYAVGEEGLVSALQSVAIRVTDPDEEPVEAVVVGIDRQFSYDKLRKAMKALRRADVRFLATNTDSSYPLEHDQLIPGAGSIVAAIATASGRTPEVAGKPEPHALKLIAEETGIPAAETLVVGDRYETDLLAGLRAGCQAYLVLSGVTSTPVEGIPFGSDVTGLV